MSDNPNNQAPQGNQPGNQPGGDNKEEGGWGGVIWFILIFGVGNLILYQTTGILIIPIPRK